MFQNHKKAVVDYPDMINEIIQEVFAHFDQSSFVTGEVKNILALYTRKKDYVYLIKPDSIASLAKHPSGLVKHFPVLDQISLSYIVNR